MLISKYRNPPVILLCLLSLLSAGDASSKEEVDIAAADLKTLSLEDLLNVETGVASKVKISMRSAPGIVTIITSEEIANSGIRDFVDLLRLISGYNNPVIDVSNMTYLGIRGFSTADGKVLLLIDGVQMNTFLFGDLPIGLHFPVEHIERIEIIRGPGSVMYGGVAELGVINVITKGTKELQGTTLSATYGQMENTYGHKMVNMMFGKEIGDFKVSIKGLAGHGHRSDRDYIDLRGNHLDMSANNQLFAEFVNAHIQYKDLSLRWVHDNYRDYDRDSLAFSIRRSGTNKKTFRTDAIEAQYQGEITEDFKVNARFLYNFQNAWRREGLYPPWALLHERKTDSYLTDLSLQYNLTDKLHLVVGVESNRQDFNTSFFPGEGPSYYNTPIFRTQTVFAEVDYQSADWGNVTLGARFDKPNFFPSQLVPRFAYTKIFKPFHIKALLSESYHSPRIADYTNNKDIKPEKARTAEFELGYQINDDMAVIVNLFDVRARDAIVWRTISTDEQGAINTPDKMGTRGIETEFRVKKKWGYLTANYSFYKPTATGIDDFRIIDQRTDEVVENSMFLGFAAHKIALNANYQVTTNFSINPSFNFFGPTYSYGQLENGQLIPVKYSSRMLANVFFRYQNLYVKGFEAGLGIYNLFNEDMYYYSANNGGHAPLPDRTREIFLKLSYTF